MGLNLTLALSSSVAAVALLVLGVSRYPITDHQRFMRWVYGPPLPYLPVWWQLGLGLALAVVAGVCWFRILRRNPTAA